METRAFNSISIDSYKGVLTKTSSNISKLKDEINYYLKLPNNILNLFPKLIDYNNNFTSYTIEYIPNKSLAELLLKNQLSINKAKYILDNLLVILNEIHATKLVKPDLKTVNKKFLIKKTIDRIFLLQNNPLFADLVNSSQVTINGRSYKTFKHYQKQFTQILENFFENHPVTTIIHGDFSFSNILYCPFNHNIKLIDPRGSFGNEGIYGHPYYDYAKLMHCIYGSYDHIVSGNFELIEKTGLDYDFCLSVPPIFKELYLYFKNLLHERNFDVEVLHLIEFSLFLSMTPLHYEDPKRQKALFLNGLILMNNFFERRYENMH